MLDTLMSCKFWIVNIKLSMVKQTGFLLLFLCSYLPTTAQNPASTTNKSLQAVAVPSTILFAGMTLEIDNAAKKDIQTSVDALLRYPDFFLAKVERANMYYPIIERIFKEEGLPDDFKYLVLQESALVSDAVSTSNAIGFWQFKVDAAKEVGLRIDDVVDERKNIVAATRGAAKYLKKNNVFLKNWTYALLSYNLGLGGVKTTALNTKYVGEMVMPIDKTMHWYVLKFLAHKIAFEAYLGKNNNGNISLVEYNQCRNKQMDDIADHFRIELKDLLFYNKWLNGNEVPNDKNYTVILPVKSEIREETILEAAQPEKGEQLASHEFKRIEGETVPAFLTWNGIEAIQAQVGDNSAKLALQGGIRLRKFLRINNLEKFDEIKASQIYYLSHKKDEALVLFHTVQPGENVWDISQMYGITIEAILNKNRMEATETLKPGRIVYLKNKRPENEPVKFELLPPAIVVAISDTNKLYHKVELKQTLYGIAQKYAVPVDSIKTWNKITTVPLEVGQVLIVKQQKNTIYQTPKKTVPEGFIVHVVLKGETLFKISQSYPGLHVAQIKLWNHKVDDNVFVGEELLIKKSR
jgi:membrane-bound lytic murein transglycosylase D